MGTREGPRLQAEEFREALGLLLCLCLSLPVAGMTDVRHQVLLWVANLDFVRKRVR